MGVDGVGGVQPQHVSGLGGIERSEDEAVGASVERAVVRREPLHHVQIAAEQQQKHRASGQQPVPRGL